MATDTVKALGGVPVSIPTPEQYIALEKGLLDVQVVNWEAMLSFKTFEVTKYRTVLPRGFISAFLGTGMNWDSWNSLPPDVQAVFEEVTGGYMTTFCGENFDAALEDCRPIIIEHDQKVGNPEVYNMPDDEFQRWLDAVAPVREQWVTRMEDMGYSNARAVLEDALSLVEKYSK